jgi:hypothetical protein
MHAWTRRFDSSTATRKVSSERLACEDPAAFQAVHDTVAKALDPDDGLLVVQDENAIAHQPVQGARDRVVERWKA